MSETHRVTCGVAEDSSLLDCYAVSSGSRLLTFRRIVPWKRWEMWTSLHGATQRTYIFHKTACCVARHTDPSLEFSLLITFHSHILFTQCSSHVTTWLILMELLFLNERHTCGWFRHNQPDSLISIIVSFGLGFAVFFFLSTWQTDSHARAHTHKRKKYENYNLGYFNLSFQIADKEAKDYRTHGSKQVPNFI